MDRSEWRAWEGPAFVGDAPYRVDCTEFGVCPGWLMRQATVVECRLAAQALERGALETYYPHPDNATVEGALYFLNVVRNWEAHEMRRASERRG